MELHWKRTGLYQHQSLVPSTTDGTGQPLSISEVEWLCRDQERELSMKPPSSLTQPSRQKCTKEAEEQFVQEKMEKREEAHSGSHSCHCGSWHNASTVPTPSQHQRFQQGYRFFTCILARTRVTGIVNSVRSRKCFYSAKHENLKYISG